MYFTDPSLTVQIVEPIVVRLNHWAAPHGEGSSYTTWYIVPSARAEIIHQQNASKDQQCSLASYYYVNITPGASWHDLARVLYRTEQSKAAVDAFRVQLPKPEGQCLFVRVPKTLYIS